MIKDIKGVILVGGSGTRLLPCTKVTNKHLLPVYNQPMIFYAIQSLVKAGIKNILIVSGRGHAGHFLELLGSGNEFGANLSYEVQEKAGGIAQALGLAEDFAHNGKILVILGDNIFEDDLRPAIKRFERQGIGAKVFLKKVANPRAYGVAALKGRRIINIKEKPKHTKSNLAVTGIYMYDDQIFNIIKRLKPSARGELEITDVNNFYVKQGTMTHEVLRGFWGDCGESFDSLLKATERIAKIIHKSK